MPPVPLPRPGGHVRGPAAVPAQFADDPVTAAAFAARGGSRAGAEAFVRGTSDDVWRLCRHLGPAGQAEDLAQETYARAFAGIDRYAGRAPARAWLLGIARHVCADAVAAAVRDRSRRAAVLDPTGDLGATDPRGPVAPDHAGGVALDLLLGALDPDRREAFVLTQLLGLEYAEAAAVCGCPVGTIRSRVARARDDLRRAHGQV